MGFSATLDHTESPVMLKHIATGARTVAVVVCLCLCCSACSRTCPPLPAALDALQTTATVAFQQTAVAVWDGDSYYAFAPRNAAPAAGFIFYPGAFVDPRAYAPCAAAIAAAGYLVVIVTMPGDFPELGYERADDVRDAFDTITTWATGGHSMGGKMGCKYLLERGMPADITAVILWASRPSHYYDLHATDIAALSIYGTNDGLATPAIIDDSRNHLPADTVWVPVAGGNHTQFGYYDTAPLPVQRNDHPADISRAAQQQIIVGATIAFLDTL